MPLCGMVISPAAAIPRFLVDRAHYLTCEALLIHLSANTTFVFGAEGLCIVHPGYLG